MRRWRAVVCLLSTCLACGGGDAGLNGPTSPPDLNGADREAGTPIGSDADAATAGGINSGGSTNGGSGGSTSPTAGDGGFANGGFGNGGDASGGTLSDGGALFDAGAGLDSGNGGAGGTDPGELEGGIEPPPTNNDAGDDTDASAVASDAAVSDAAVAEPDASDPGSDDAGVDFDAGTAQFEAPRNVIFLMADGYGPEQIEATRIYVNGNTAPLSFETLPHQAWVRTFNARNQITDSAAAATAMATGHKVDLSVVSVGIPGNSGDLNTALEVQKSRGKRTGIVTTHTPITDASPAGFGSHAAARTNTAEIAATYFNETKPNVLFGLTSTGITAPAAQAAGYTVVNNAAGLAALDLDTETHISGQFSEGTLPPLKDMALAALDLLEESPEGFFLFVEQEQTDTAGHANDLSTVITAAIEFNAMVDDVLAWAQGRDDTLVIVGADHETGGLTVNEPNPTVGVVPTHSYSTTNHSNADVRFFATGVGASRLLGTLDNTELFPLFAGYQAVWCSDSSACAAGALHDVLRESMPSTALSSGTSLLSDLDDAGFEVQSLLAFSDLDDLLPVGCSLQAAHLVLPVSNGSTAGVRLHRMLSSWSESSTWNSFGGNGIQANDVEALATADAQSGATSPGVLTFNVTDAVSAWLNNPSSNHGWALLARGTDGMSLNSTTHTAPPELRLFCE